MAATQEQTIQAEISSVKEQMEAIRSFRDRMELSDAGDIAGVSEVLTAVAGLYREFAETMAACRSLLEEDMLQAETLLQELEEVDEGILYQANGYTECPAQDAGGV